MRLRLAIISCATILCAFSLFARSGSRPVAWPGQPVPNDSGWPVGAVELINDPARTEGWNPWFSGWPSDMGCYLYKLIDSQDANRLIQRLAAIRANVHLKLSPAREAGALGFTTHMKVGNDHAAVFSLGNQRVLDEWFAQRTRAQPGRGKTGVRPAANPSVALTPTLTLFAGHPAIDLTKLEIPARLQVSADLPDAVRKEKAGDPTLRAIDAFVAQHQAKKKTSDGASEVK